MGAPLVADIEEHVLLNLLNELGKRSTVKLAKHFIAFSQ